jgi:hypothetical protein
MPGISQIVNFFLALLFIVFAYLQFDDPDPLVWIVIYGNMAVLCMLGIFRIRIRLWILVSGIAYGVYAAFLFPGALEWFNSPDRSVLFDDLAKMQFPYVEETREFLGLLISILVLIFQGFNPKQ